MDVETEHNDGSILVAPSQLIELASEPFLDRIVERISPAGTVEPVGAGDPHSRLPFNHIKQYHRLSSIQTRVQIGGRNCLGPRNSQWGRSVRRPLPHRILRWNAEILRLGSVT